MNNEYLFCGRWYRPDYIDAHRSSMEPPSQTLPTEGGEATQRTKGEEKRIERNGGAARSANLGGCKGRAANGGEGKSGRFNRPEKEERSDAEDEGEREGKRCRGRRELPQICDRNEK